MVLGLLKSLNEASFYEKKKEIIIKTYTLHKRKAYIKKKERVFGLRKSIYINSIGIYETCIKNENNDLSFLKKKTIRLYCL